jgi:hypothetical protein
VFPKEANTFKKRYRTKRIITKTEPKAAHSVRNTNIKRLVRANTPRARVLSL